MFTILVGSVAKAEHKVTSDIDIVRIDHQYEVQRKEEWPQGPINYIDYSLIDFHKLYFKGSLFIYHVLHEGILISGCKELWGDYIKNFQFIDTYAEELFDLRDIMYDVFNISIYGGTFLSFYANLFSLVKNFSIFFLAHNNIFEFNKETAFVKVFGRKYFFILNSAYNIFERNDYSYLDTIDFKSEVLADDIVKYLYKKLEELI